MLSNIRTVKPKSPLLWKSYCSCAFLGYKIFFKDIFSAAFRKKHFSGEIYEKFKKIENKPFLLIFKISFFTLEHKFLSLPVGNSWKYLPLIQILEVMIYLRIMKEVERTYFQIKKEKETPSTLPDYYHSGSGSLNRFYDAILEHVTYYSVDLSPDMFKECSARIYLYFLADVIKTRLTIYERRQMFPNFYHRVDTNQSDRSMKCIRYSFWNILLEPRNIEMLKRSAWAESGVNFSRNHLRPIRRLYWV